MQSEGKSKSESKKNRISKLYNQQVYHLLKGQTGQVAAEQRLMDTNNENQGLPPNARKKLHNIFALIEKEFENLYLENASLQEKLDSLTEKLDRESIGTATERPADDCDGLSSSVRAPTSTTKVFTSSGRLKSHKDKLKYQTNKIMSGLKVVNNTLAVNSVKRYPGHKDGVWEVAVSRLNLPILATGSADQTANIWGMHSGHCLLQYQGHSGSVNSIRFHPNKELVLTASGDGTAHIWQCAVNLFNEANRVGSSEDELDPTEREFLDGHDYSEDSSHVSVLRTPLRSLQGHTGVVISGDWIPGGEQVLTAGWDRLACIWDAHTGELIQQLGGHDDELTHCATHASQRLVVTSSKDSTFRLWDFRETIHSVSVFQGHQDTVTSAVFVPNTDYIVSGSDDRSAKVWDLRNMRSAVANMQADSAINRISVSSQGLIAVPYDNRNVRLFDLQGNRLARLPRSSRQGHARMVCCTAWTEEHSQQSPNLFTCGFDRQVLGWSVQPREEKQDKEEKEGFRLNLSLRGKDMSSLKEHLSKDGKT